MKRVIYISGKISGLDFTGIVKKFEQAEIELREAGHTGFMVNPTKLGIDENEGWDAAMEVCMRSIRKCNCIYMLRDWNDSRGAKIEFQFAAEHGFEIFYQDNKRQLYQAFEMHNHLHQTFCFRSNFPEIQATLLLRYYGIDNQLLKAVEEMSELTREIARLHISMQSDGEESVLITDSYVDELADVIIMVEQLKVGLFDLGFKAALECKIREKLARQINRIQTEDVHRLSDYKHNSFGHE